MYDGKQVVRVENQYKRDDLYNIGVEMSNRKGTGNYDKTRTEFNVEYVPIMEKNLYASLLINSNASINVVAKYLGHTKIDETLNTYSHLFKNKMNEIIEIIDKLN